MGKDKKTLGVGKNVFFAWLATLFMNASSEMIYP